MLGNVRFQVLTVASMKFRFFRDIAPCSHVEVDRRFGGAYCLHHGNQGTLYIPHSVVLRAEVQVFTQSVR
jgi:hypothetical protein